MPNQSRDGDNLTLRFQSREFFCATVAKDF